MQKQMEAREREQEKELLQRKQEMDDREERLNQMYRDFDTGKQRDMNEITKKIRTAHELIKTVMHLHHYDISDFEGGDVFRNPNQRNFSFDITKQVKINESQNSNRDSEEKEKVIN